MSKQDNFFGNDGHVICKDGFECDLINSNDGQIYFTNMKINGEPIKVNGKPSAPVMMSAKDAFHELQKVHGGVVSTGPSGEYENEPLEEIEDSEEESLSETEEDFDLEEMENKDTDEYYGDDQDHEPEENGEPEEAEPEVTETEGYVDTDEEETEEDQQHEDFGEEIVEEIRQSFTTPEGRYLSTMAQEYSNKLRNNDGSIIKKDINIKGDLSAVGDIELEGSINGNVSTEGEIMVTGKVEGNITASQVMLSGSSVTGDINTTELTEVIDGATLVGDIKTKNAVITGNVKGNIICSETVKAKDNAVIYGNIKARSIQVEEGVKTLGTVEVLGDDSSLDGLFPSDNGKASNKKKDTKESAKIKEDEVKTPDKIKEIIG